MGKGIDSHDYTSLCQSMRWKETLLFEIYRERIDIERKRGNWIIIPSLENIYGAKNQ